MKKYWLIFLIIFLAAIVRFWQLGTTPSDFTPDEAAQGYTAYSYLQTGHDEWGSRNPLIMQSFGDYKPPFQTWLMMLSVKFLGLNQFSVRLPSAIFGLITVILIYLITGSALATALAAFSPWLLPISRLALEANVVVTVFLLGFWLFLHHSKSKIFIILSAICFGLTPFIYHSAKVVTPLFLIGLFFIYYRRIKRSHIIIFSTIILALFAANLFINRSVGLNRNDDIAIFNPTDHWAAMANSRYQLTQAGLPPIISRLIANKVTYTVKVFSQSYFSYFSPQFLLTSGAGETTYGMLPDFGVTGIVGTIGVISSIIFLIKSKKITPEILATILIIIISPLPAALAKGQFSANRVSLMAPGLIIFSAFGLQQLFKKNSLRLLLLGVFFLETIYFILTYFFQANSILAQGMLFGHQQVNQYLQNYPDYHVIYSRRLSEPQAYYLFYQQFPPQYVSEYTSDWQHYSREGHSFLDQLGTYSLPNVTFRNININADAKLSKTIIIGRPDEFNGLQPTQVIYYPNNIIPAPAIYILNTNEK